MLEQKLYMFLKDYWDNFWIGGVPKEDILFKPLISFSPSHNIEKRLFVHEFNFCLFWDTPYFKVLPDFVFVVA